MPVFGNLDSILFAIFSVGNLLLFLSSSERRTNPASLCKRRCHNRNVNTTNWIAADAVLLFIFTSKYNPHNMDLILYEVVCLSDQRLALPVAYWSTPFILVTSPGGTISSFSFSPFLSVSILFWPSSQTVQSKIISHFGFISTVSTDVFSAIFVFLLLFVHSKGIRWKCGCHTDRKKIRFKWSSWGYGWKLTVNYRLGEIPIVLIGKASCRESVSQTTFLIYLSI